jgi:hypothetical protein
MIERLIADVEDGVVRHVDVTGVLNPPDGTDIPTAS